MAELSSPAAVIEIATATPWVRKSPSPWVRGPVWDGFWMLSALWLAPIILWLSHGYSNPESSPLDLLYFGLTALFWIGHRLSSTYLAYCTEAYRPLLRLKPIRFVVLPLAITAACFAIFLPGDSALPWTREERLIGLAIVRSEEHTSELQSLTNLVCRLLLEKKKKNINSNIYAH